jgi:histidyl-tRNA synthetase
MWSFDDKGGRPVCLIPEVTGLIQELWREKWRRTNKVKRIFYVSRCYRYERPQAGRYREFTQFGIELLGKMKMDQKKLRKY